MSATYTVTITPKPATGNGDLDGFAVTCTCGNVNTWSLRGMAESDARDHEAWHARNPQRRPARTTKPARKPKAADPAKALATTIRKSISLHRRATSVPGGAWKTIGTQARNTREDWGWSVYTAIQGVAYAVNTGRVSGATSITIRELSDWDKCALVADIALACRVMGDVPRYLNKRFAA